MDVKLHVYFVTGCPGGEEASRAGSAVARVPQRVRRGGCGCLGQLHRVSAAAAERPVRQPQPQAVLLHGKPLPVRSGPICSVPFSFVSLRSGSVLFRPVLFCSVPVRFVPFCSGPIRPVLFRSVRSVSFCSVLFRFVLLCSVLFCSILLCFVLFCSVPFHSVPFLFCSVPFGSVLLCGRYAFLKRLKRRQILEDNTERVRNFEVNPFFKATKSHS